MKARKILNNNVVLTRNDQRQEVIVMGKGLAFGMKNGDEIDQSRVEKIFSLNNSGEASRFKELLEFVPEEYFEMTEEFINYAKETLGSKLKNSIYLSLTDHVNTMMERVKTGAYLKNAMLWDIKRLYRDEFAVAVEITNRLNKRMGTSFDESEAASIAMHFVNAQTEFDLPITTNITKLMTQILNIVKYNFRIEYNEDSLAYYRFIVHLRSFAQRLFSETTYQDTDDLDLLQLIERKYPAAYHCAELVQQYILENHNYHLGSEELMYLTIHIEKVVRDSNRV